MLNSIRGKMIFYIALPTTLIYLVALGFALFFTYQESRQIVQNEMVDLAKTSAARFNDYISKAAQLAETTARVVENSPAWTEAQIYAVLQENVAARKRVYGSAMAFEPGTFKKDDSLFCPYVFKAGPGELKRLNIDRSILDWYSDPQWQWWSQAKKTQKALWTDPYFDEGAGNILMSTYSVPFFKAEKFTGVVTVDIDLLGLKDEVGDLIADNHNFFIMTANGQFVYSPLAEHIMDSTILEVARQSGSLSVEKAQKVISGQTGVVLADGVFQHEKKLIAYSPIESNKWIFAVSIPESEAYRGFRDFLPSLIIPFLAALALTFGAILFVSSALTKPIQDLQGAVLKIAAGDLDVKAAVKSRDEIGSLAQNFNQMTRDLSLNISKLAVEESERINAEEANVAKSRFLSHMSHELRTPLNGILGYAQALRKNPQLGVKQQQMVDSIANCGDYLLSLINDILDLSKIEAGKMELELGPTSLMKLIGEVSDVVRLRAENKGLNFVIEKSPEIPKGISIDGSKLRQVLINLLGNAVKFCDEGSITFAINITPQGLLSFTVRDTGIGITEAQKSFVFEAFKQAEGGKKAGGSGLGLSIAKQLSEKMQGSLSFESRVGEGTTFTLEIPFTEVELEETPEPESVESSIEAVLSPKVEEVVLFESVPAELRERFQQAFDIKNITAMKKIAIELRQNEACEDSAEKIISLIEAFDFDSLEIFLKHSK